MTPPTLTREEIGAIRHRLNNFPLADATLLTLCDLAERVLDAEAQLHAVEQRANEMARAHAASFGALAAISAALCDGEVDDYLALADKVIERVRQAEARRDRLRAVVEAAFSYRANRREIMGNTHDAVDALMALDAAVADLDALGPVREETP